MENHNRTVPRTASQLIHSTDVHLWCITSCDLHMDADIVATHQTSPATIAYTFSRDCISINFAHVTSFLLADLRPCEWLSPHHFAEDRGSGSRCSLPNISRAYNLHWDLISSRFMEALCSNSLIKSSFLSLHTFDSLAHSRFHNSALELVQSTIIPANLSVAV